MINFHPDLVHLRAFAQGTCPTNLALMVSAHVDMCPRCQALVMQAQEEIGSEVFSGSSEVIDPSPDYNDMLQQIMQSPAFEVPEVKPISNILELDGKRFELPRALARYSEKTGNWSRLVGKLWQAPVDLGQEGQANFIYMEKGGKVPEHTHKGTEFTLVIDGQFSDGLADYDCGDFTIMDSTNKHMPFSEADEGCLVFTMVDKPLYFTSGLARLLNPFSQLFFK
ncbi:ChrR family anti-sigma-E factor [Paraglaciecola chathamensis]|jgi:putative transcriptional regulator|uniref:Transcriptional regulator n=1 Tax=Paraglaciecola chathamensis TaxID=368405 RepID=A0A8H9IA01_9ALTE|nr:ChrR family anti-sigma-E factor [Paraglaciecola oceanifecundans]GGZ64706.1 transcriptional regulator [Paraglaciecola oceanifecundans]|tara:strand:- start:998 stop:1669 length:672 start_codon:yes stop_codon:yes gene_type:complete